MAICIISIAQQASPKVIHINEPVRAHLIRSSAAVTRKTLVGQFVVERCEIRVAHGTAGPGIQNTLSGWRDQRTLHMLVPAHVKATHTAGSRFTNRAAEARLAWGVLERNICSEQMDSNGTTVPCSVPGLTKAGGREPVAETARKALVNWLFQLRGKRVWIHLALGEFRQ